MTIAKGMDVFSKIINKRLRSISLSFDTLSLSFEDDWVLAIFNVIRLHRNNIECDLTQINLVEGKFLTNIITTEQEIIMRFTEDLEITVDLTEEAFTGPEAVELIGPENEIIVWR